jgi:hypothetical protein
MSHYLYRVAVSPELERLTFLLRSLAVILVLIVSVVGQNATLTQEQVVQMSKAGLPEDVIVARIKAEPKPLKVSTDDLIKLKKAGVSDGVIRALASPGSTMSSGNAAPAASPTATIPAASLAATPAADPTPTADPNDPNAPHDPGVYLYATDRDGKRKMEFIDEVGAGREKTHMTWVHGSNMKAELPGPRAAVRTADATPVFYMYFSPGANISEVGSISSPSQFSLVALDAKAGSQGGYREVRVAHHGLLHMTYGNDEKKSSLFDSKRIRPYVYKVTPNGSLNPGEYAFIATTSLAGTAQGASVVMYDFGVDGR